MLTHTQSLRSLRLIFPYALVEDWAVAAAQSRLKKNTTLRELTLEFSLQTVSPMLTSLRDHPHLRRLCLRGCGMNLTELETVLLSNTSKITELDIDTSNRDLPMMSLTHVLQALARRSMLTKLGLRCCPLDRDEGAKLLRVVLGSSPSLQTRLLF
jgi:hypothetical protein